MSDATNQALSEAYELIEADRLVEAEAILKPILADEPDNADAWWLYSYAVTDVETARMALNTVLHLDKDYPGAAELLQTLEEKYPAHTTAKSDIRKLAPQPPSLPDLPEDEDMEPVVNYLDDSEPILARDRQMKSEAQPPRSSARKPSRLPIFVGLLLLIVLVVALLFLVLRRPTPASNAVTPTTAQQQAAVDTPTGDQQTVEAAVPTTDQQTQEAGVPTAESTEDATSATAEATVSPLEAEVTPISDTAANSVQGALADFTLAADGIGTLDTQLGTTLVAGVCTTSGQQMRDTLTGSMNALSAVADTIGDTDAIGVRLVNCDTNEVLRVIAVPIADAASFAAGQSDDTSYQSKWVAVA